MTVERDIKLNVITEIREFQKEFAKIPGFTQKTAATAAKQFIKEQQKAQREVAKIARDTSAAAAKQFVREQRKAQREAAKAAKQAADDSAKAWEDVGTLILGSLSADAIKGAALAVFDFASEVNALRTEQINLAAATGISTETFAGLEIAAKRSGVRVEEILGGFEDFGEVLFDFENGGGRAKEALELLDIQAKKTDGSFRNTDEVLREVLSGMVGVEDQAQRNAIAQQLFGDAGNRLNAVLGDGTLEDYIELAEQFGTVVDDDAAEATREWNRAIADFSSLITGAATDLTDFLLVAQGIRNLTVSLIFLRAGAAATFDDLSERAVQLGDVISNVVAGDFDAAATGIVDNLTTMDNSLIGIGLTAVREAAEFANLRKEIEKGGDADDERADGLGRLSDEMDKAAKAAAKLAKEEAKRGKEFVSELGKIAKAQDDLAGIVRSAGDDQLTAFDKVAQARADQIAQIEELERVTGQTLATEIARDEVNARATRDRIEADNAAFLAVSEASIEFDELDAELKQEQLDRINRNREASLQAVQMLGDAAGDLLSIQIANTEAAGAAAAASLTEQQALREELLAQLEAAETIQEERRIQNDLDAVDRTIAKNEAILASEQGQIKKLFGARKTLEIISTIISGASAGVAALAPPPIGLGPVAGIPLAVAVAATTGAQIAVIASQQAPQFHSGFPGFSGGPDEFQATLRAGESVNNQRATDALGGRQAVDDMNNTGAVPTGGVASGSVDRSRLGRLLGQIMVDEMGAGRELTRDMNRRTQRRAGVRPVYAVR